MGLGPDGGVSRALPTAMESWSHPPYELQHRKLHHWHSYNGPSSARFETAQPQRSPLRTSLSSTFGPDPLQSHLVEVAKTYYVGDNNPAALLASSSTGIAGGWFRMQFVVVSTSQLVTV